MNEQNLHFKISSATKSILGKDLIVDKNIAIFELVKNAYDACASKVDIYIESDKITIIDNGDGMDLNDLVNKWLFVGYSEKSENNIKIERKCKRKTFAGAKGIGRLACDRIGEKLKLTSIKNNNIEQLDVEWGEFEKDSRIDFSKIDITHKTLANNPYLDITKGTILEMTHLREEWGENDILKIKQHLTKLISPVKEDKDSFEIFLHYKDFKTSEYLVIPVENFIFEQLGLKTTEINIEVSSDGKEIITELNDRGDKIYKIIEKNQWSNKIAGIKIQLLYISRPTKMSFYHLMQQRTYDFGSIFLYNNGFRVFPYGEPGDDSLELDRRKQQGYARYLGTRELIGYIIIENGGNEFKETSSRDGGLLNTKGYKELVDLFTEKALKRLEVYTIDTLNWTYNLETETELFPENKQEGIKKLVQKLTKTEEFIKLDYSFNIEEKIDKKVNEEFQGATGILKKEAERSGDITLKKAVDKIEKIQREQKEIIAKQDTKIEKTEQKLEQEKKKGAFQGALISTDKERIIGLQHQILHSSSRINRNIKLILQHLNSNLDPKLKKYIKTISLEASKINSIANFVTKANFNLKATKITSNIVDFITGYINEIYLIEDNIIDTKLKIEFIDKTNKEILREFVPLELTTIIDIFISNAEKAEAKEMKFLFSEEQDKLKLEIIDNGNGIDSENIEKVFDLGYTTTEGSGIGLFQAFDLIKNSFKGNIDITSDGKGKGIKINISI